MKSSRRNKEKQFWDVELPKEEVPSLDYRDHAAWAEEEGWTLPPLKDNNK